MNFLLSVSPIRDTGHRTKRRKIILIWLGTRNVIIHEDYRANDDDDDSDEKDKKDDDDDH